MFWLVLAYPTLAHLSVWLSNRSLQWLALVCLLATGLWNPLLSKRPWAWLALFVGAAALFVVTRRGNGMYALYAPPILIPLAMLLLFARSLRKGETPLITRIATTMRGEPLPEALRIYTRRVTQLWCGVSTLLIISALTSAIWANAEVWSLMTNLVHYLALGAVFVLEFFYRRLRYRQLEPWGLLQYLRRLTRVNLRA